MSLTLAQDLQVTLYHGDEAGPWGFCSSVYGEKQPCPTVVGRLRARLPQILETQLRLQ